MNRQMLRYLASLTPSLALAASLVLLAAVRVGAQCNEVASGLRTPLGKKGDTLYVTELGGRLVAVPIP